MAFLARESGQNVSKMAKSGCPGVHNFSVDFSKAGSRLPLTLNLKTVYIQHVLPDEPYPPDNINSGSRSNVRTEIRNR